MKILIFIIIILVPLTFCNNVFALQLSDEQFENLEILHNELKKKDSNFVGFNGSKDKMGVVGISETDAQKVIDKVNITELKKKTPRKLLNKSAIEKLQATIPGITIDEIKSLGIKVEE